jgi:hypothetical protein
MAIARRTVAGNRFRAAPAATPPKALFKNDRRSFDIDQISFASFGIDQFMGVFGEIFMKVERRMADRLRAAALCLTPGAQLLIFGSGGIRPSIERFHAAA